MRVRGVAALLAALMLAPAPAPALPVGPPTVALRATPLPDPLSYRIDVEASDPDGPIREIEICVEDPAHDVCRVVGRFSTDPTKPVRDCIHGSTHTESMTHTFAEPGVYRVTASVVGGGCPVLGSDERAETELHLVVPPPRSIPCADDHASPPSDDGVEDDEIHLGAVVSLGGRDASRGNAAYQGMAAAVRAINDGGGVCDRMLVLDVRDDGSDPAVGETAVKELIARGVFALVVMPSTETLVASLDEIDEEAIPTVGTVGGARDEFAAAHVWPSGPANRDVAAVMVRQAYDEGARRFAIVYDAQARAGTEIRDGIRTALEARADAEIAIETALYPGRASYSAEIAAFNEGCDGACDTVVYALDPHAMLTWTAGRPQRGRVSDELPPRLFSSSFASVCGAACHGMRAWVGFQPPIGSEASDVAWYVEDVRRLYPTADVTDQDLEAAYAGTLAFALAAGMAGRGLTRAGLEDVLAVASLDIGLTGAPLSWSVSRYANHYLRSYSIVAVSGSFAGWRAETGWLDAHSTG